MVSRSASCADCGATVVSTSAAPVVRAGAVLLLCGSCRGEPQRRPPAPAPPADEDEDDYDAMEISAEPADEALDYDDLTISTGEEPRPPDRNVVYSEFSPAVSGDIDTDESPDDPN